jgi:ferredoxin-NADP reductase/nitrite reductase/ring-hydroxylating ferredoxin subunit
MDLDTLQLRWHPIASIRDLVPRHVFHAQILGRELAVWRADDGNINAWENRCLHRGVRLSIGVNDGHELVCQYHGWRYANRTAGCTYIPAHPADAPARSICNITYPAVKHRGFVWSGEQPQGSPPELPELAGESLTLRPIPVNAPFALLIDYLQRDAQCLPLKTQQQIQAIQKNDLAISYTVNDQCFLVCLLQPVDSNRTVLRGSVPEAILKGNQTELLHHFNHAFNRIRNAAEKQAARQGPLPAFVAPIKPVAEHLASMPVKGDDNRRAALRVTVQSIETIASDIKAITLMPVEQPIPTFHPGAHIDLHLPNGLIRQYSLTNSPGQTDRLVLAVKRDPASSGGSSHIHEHLKVGDLLATSEPRNNFPLRRDALKTKLIAGGIGITPLINMAQALAHLKQQFELHYFVQNASQIAFKSILDELGHQSTLHINLDVEQTEAQLIALFSNYEPATHNYVCGPAPMLDAARRIAKQQQWPDMALHIEYFKNTRPRDLEQAFEVSLARSGLTLQVPAGKTLLSVLRENGVPVPSSCEQGACGTCKVAVLAGQPQHQDVFLSDTEHAQGDCLMSCVSRSLSPSLTLDI